MRPVVDGLKGEYGETIDFREVDFYKNPEMAAKYGVPGHPTLVITHSDGSASKVLPGVSDKSEIVQALEDVLK